MRSLACILHSTDGTYSDELIADATRCVAALVRSTTASSADMIPSVAVLRADPLIGTKYLYTSSVPDTNHAVEVGEMQHAPYSSSLAHVGSGASEALDLVSAFRGRSLSYLMECMVEGTRAAVAEPEEHLGELLEDRHTPNDDGKRVAGSTVGPQQKRRRREPAHTSVVGADKADPWSSLASSLLCALAFHHKHAAGAQDITTTVATTTGEEGADGTGGDGAAALQRNVIVVFSDSSAAEDSPMTYSTECAFAVAALTASKGNVVLYGFGPSLGVSASAAGGERLRALAASVGGACAGRFQPSLLGAMLEGRPRGDANPTGAVPAPVALATMTTRAKRERIADQYVLQPTVLAPRPDSSGAEVVGTAGGEGAGHGKKKKESARTVAVTESQERPSHLGWLCPQCMAVVWRSRDEGQGGAGGDTAATDDVNVYCPYCI